MFDKEEKKGKGGREKIKGKRNRRGYDSAPEKKN